MSISTSICIPLSASHRISIQDIPFNLVEMYITDPATILHLPPEILLLVWTLLDISDILQVRQTCRTLCKTTYERNIWMKKLEEQETYLPLLTELLRVYHHEDKHLHAYPVSAIESIVTKAQRTSDAWLRPRLGLPYKLRRENVGTALMGLKMFLDRWLMVFYFEGAVYLYDTQPVHQSAQSSTFGLDSAFVGGKGSHPVLRAALFLESGLWISYAVSLDSTRQTLVLALSRSIPPYMVQIYEIDVSSLSLGSLFIPDAFRLVKTIHLPSYKTVQALEPTEHLIALAISGVVELLTWDEGCAIPDSLEGRTTIRVNLEDLEGLWNGAIAVHFLGSYILVFKTRSLEIHTHTSRLHTPNKSPPPPLKHVFSMTFREVSFSQCTVSRNPVSEMETYETTLFAYDVIQGLFHYTVRVQAPISPISELLPSLEVILTGVYPLALALSNTNLFAPLPSRNPIDRAFSTSVTYSANFAPSPTPTYSHTHAPAPGSSSTARQTHGGQSDSSSRGFLSTHSMGPQGKRGMWVERKRSSTVREVQVWSRDPPSAISAYDREFSTRPDGSVPAIEIERRVVYSVHSYDLREDITCCTFGELNGTIVLGHRSGDVSILEPNYSTELLSLGSGT
ncbi:hypothetical protein BDZ97DRAFT_698875 [Flammula alnicola]|nr:hypothetical protein BDZ97DRAFT_698875 [Flammula alnicola]